MQLNNINDSNLPSHQLENQGCLCKLCQNLILYHTCRTVTPPNDIYSQKYTPNFIENYITFIRKLQSIHGPTQRLKFSLPQICSYEGSEPACLIAKKQDNAKIYIMKNQNRINCFSLQKFFLKGFAYHSGNSISSKTSCIALAKYKQNSCMMLSIGQVVDLFKAKYRKQRQGLLYLQTLVGGQHFEEIVIKIDLHALRNTPLFKRAQIQASIINREIRKSDPQYVSEADEQKYQLQLRLKDLRLYLQYLAIKMVLLFSKNQPIIYSHCILKFIVVTDHHYLWDFRAVTTEPRSKYQETASEVMQKRLMRAVHLMEVDCPEDDIQQQRLSKPTRKLTEWLKNNTSKDFDQMAVIKKRLDKLEAEKLSLEASKKACMARDPYRLKKSLIFKTKR